MPTLIPSYEPTYDPTTSMPSIFPSTINPSYLPSSNPSCLPTYIPTLKPTRNPTSFYGNKKDHSITISSISNYIQICIASIMILIIILRLFTKTCCHYDDESFNHHHGSSSISSSDHHDHKGSIQLIDNDDFNLNFNHYSITDYSALDDDLTIPRTTEHSNNNDSDIINNVISCTESYIPLQINSLYDVTLDLSSSSLSSLSS